ncbi:MAG: phospholipase D family protein [Actinomycetia bacterium]|nr:phospholipase D family protein [Actinomycetes bacterium]
MYVGSANLTGAGIGMKSDARRNFEAGVLTDSAVLAEQAIEQFDAIWRGDHCAGCGRREFIPAAACPARSAPLPLFRGRSRRRRAW